MLDIYGTLEISKVLEEIAFYSRSELAKERILNLKMLPKEDISPALKKLDEMMSYLLRFGDISLGTSFNLKPIIDDASKGAVLTASELDKVANDIDSVSKLFKQFSRVDKSLYFELFFLNVRYVIPHPTPTNAYLSVGFNPLTTTDLCFKLCTELLKILSKLSLI